MTGRCVKGSLIGCPKLEGAQAEYVKIPLARTTLFEAPEGMPDGHLILMAGESFRWSLRFDQRMTHQHSIVVGCRYLSYRLFCRQERLGHVGRIGEKAVDSAGHRLRTRRPLRKYRSVASGMV